MKALVEEIVGLQIVHIRTHTIIAARFAKGTLPIKGGIYDIERGNVLVLNEETEEFVANTSLGRFADLEDSV